MRTKILKSIVLALILCLPFTARADVQENIDAVFSEIVAGIKQRCGERFHSDDAAYMECAIKNHESMKSFFTRLWHYRDTEGATSKKFNDGTKCLENSTPTRWPLSQQRDISKTDWVKANECYMR